MKEKQLKEAVEEPQEVNGTMEQDAEVKNNVSEEVIKEETEKLKLKYSAKVNVLVPDKELQAKLHEVIGEAVDEAVIMGRAAGFSGEGADFISNSVKGFIEQAISPTDAVRAEKYKQLYLNQRLISTHLLSAFQYASSQVATYETDQQPFTSPFSLKMGNVLGAMGVGLGTLCQATGKKEQD